LQLRAGLFTMGSEVEEYDELVGFLSDQRLDVQQMAAEGVLSYTGEQGFIGFCQLHPRKVAKPLLRLVERAEVSAMEGKAAIAEASKELESTKGDAHQQERAVRQAAAEAKTAQDAGSSALQALVNLSAVPAVRDEIVSMNGPRRSVEALRGGWLEGRSGLAHWYAMLLANVTATRDGQEALCADEALVRFLIAAYISNPRPAPRDGYDDPLECLGKVFRNLCALSEGRRVLGKSSCVESLANELRVRNRRADVLGALRNLCIDNECHKAVAASGFAIQAAAFLYPWERVDEKSRAELTQEIRTELAKTGATLTADPAVRNLAAEALFGLCQSAVGREYLRICDYHEVLRAWECEESDANIKTMVSQTFKLLLESATEAVAEGEQHGGYATSEAVIAAK
jgi:hypothetical protein